MTHECCKNLETVNWYCDHEILLGSAPPAEILYIQWTRSINLPAGSFRYACCRHSENQYFRLSMCESTQLLVHIIKYDHEGQDTS